VFTGLIKETGKIVKILNTQEGKTITVQCRNLLEVINTGDSVCVNGCCLTVRSCGSGGFTADLSFSTLASTTFKNIKTGYPVNLEDSLKLNGQLGGHFVSGHVDDTGEIIRIEKIGKSYLFSFNVKKELMQYIALKGSIAVDGISLTVSAVPAERNKAFFSTAIIPHTFENTTLRIKKNGDPVNIETDLLAKYIKNLIYYSDNSTNHAVKTEDSKLEEKLREHGFF
jgi:riboflavin synthase